MIFFKPKTVTLDCFVTNNSIAELFPISSMSENIPNWWKGMRNEVPVTSFPIGMSTIKRCPGFTGLFKKGICIPAWSEYKLYQDPVHGFSHIAPNSIAAGNQHQETQFEGAFDNHQHFKLISPWLIKEKQGINFAMIQASWHNSNPCDYHIPVGSLEFKYQHSTHINLLAPKSETLKEHSILAGQPLVYLIPMTEKTVKVKIHVVSNEEWTTLKTYHHSFHNSYETTKKILKEKQ
jgi:hypothetical protein